MIKAALLALTITLYTGTQTTVQEAAGKSATIVSFWATWCEGCKKELLEIDKLLPPTIEDTMTTQKVKLVLVNLDPDKSAAVTWVMKNLKNPIFLKNLYTDPECTLPEAFNAGDLPSTLLLNSKGEVVKTYHKLDVAGFLTDLANTMGVKP